MVEDLADGHSVQLASVHIERDELLLVQAIGSRGDRSRRTRTRQHPVAMKIGPYEVRGYLHALPGSDPIAGFRRRRPMVPLTDAWVEFVSGEVRQRRRVATVIVNRQLVDWIVEAFDDEVEMPDVPLSTYPKGPLLKDFTGHVRLDQS
jgi:hypothetical protein